MKPIVCYIDIIFVFFSLYSL